jgi:nucleoid-associated protein YgaU
MVSTGKLVSALTGVGAGGGELEKLTIGYRDGRKVQRRVEALFNPSEINISRSVTYEAERLASQNVDIGFVQRFKSVEAATLSIELFFDTYERHGGGGGPLAGAAAMLMPSNPFSTGDATDVRRLTRQVRVLAQIDTELHRPPVCSLSWGTFDIFHGFMSSLDERFTMFLEDGTPVRATLTCSFVQSFSLPTRRAGEMHSADVAKTRTVRRHDTLQSIAADEYDDPTQWRAIARANGIVNPRTLVPGTVLTIPKLRP